MSLRFDQDRLGWPLDAGLDPEHPAVYRSRLDDALRAAGKPVE